MSSELIVAIMAFLGTLIGAYLRVNKNITDMQKQVKNKKERFRGEYEGL